MRARRVIAVLCVASGLAAAGEPKPTAVDVKAFKDKLQVFEDPQGGTYVVLLGASPRMWFGTGKTLYEQVVIGHSSDGETGAWDVSAWTPRVPNIQNGSIQHRADGTFARWCGGDKATDVKAITADRAKGIIDKAQFMSTAMTRKPYLLARDDAGTYYYVDVIREQYGGSGFRVFAGKKGAMKQLSLTDVATDTAGDVFSTKAGDVRIVHDSKTAAFVKGEKRTPLVELDVDANSRLIFKDLGIYTFTGTICDDI